MTTGRLRISERSREKRRARARSRRKHVSLESKHPLLRGGAGGRGLLERRARPNPPFVCRRAGREQRGPKFCARPSPGTAASFREATGDLGVARRRGSEVEVRRRDEIRGGGYVRGFASMQFHSDFCGILSRVSRLVWRKMC